MNFKLGEKIKA